LKKLIELGCLLITMLVTTSAFAAFTDLNYNPKKGFLHVDARYNYNYSTYDFETNALEKYYTITSTYFNTNFAYGFSESFRLSLGLNYKIGGETESEITTYAISRSPVVTTTKDSNKGILDPVLMGSFTLMEEDKTVVDLNLGMQVSIGKKKVDNALRGGHVAKSSLDVSTKKGNWEFWGALGIDYNLKSEQEASDGTTSTAEKSSIDYSLTGFTQHHMTSRSFMKYGLLYKVFGKKTSSGTIHEYGPALGYKYAFTKTFSADLEYNFQVNDSTENNGYTSTQVHRGFLGIDMTF